jgi:hypothetical protein
MGSEVNTSCLLWSFVFLMANYSFRRTTGTAADRKEMNFIFAGDE